MSLTLYTGFLLDLEGEEEVLEDRRATLEIIDAALRERGLPEHVEPEEGDSWCHSIQYGAVDDFKAAVLKLWKAGRLGIDEATASHLLSHYIVEGLWLPVDFDRPFVVEIPEPSEDSVDENDGVLSPDMGPGELEGFVAYLRSVGKDEMAQQVLARVEAGENPLGSEPQFVVGSCVRLLATLDAILAAIGFDLDPSDLEVYNDGMDYDVRDERFEAWLRTPAGMDREAVFLLSVALPFHEGAREAIAAGVSLVAG